MIYDATTPYSVTVYFDAIRKGKIAMYGMPYESQIAAPLIAMQFPGFTKLPLNLIPLL